jgi:hypothetical protein
MAKKTKEIVAQHRGKAVILSLGSAELGGTHKGRMMLLHCGRINPNESLQGRPGPRQQESYVLMRLVV